MTEDREAAAARIIHNMVAMKLAVTLNSLDNERHRSGQTITYLVDADIYSLFIDPVPDRKRTGGERPEVTLFHDIPTATRPALAAEYETAEYIFSGRLPGQQSTELPGETKRPRLFFLHSHYHEYERINWAIQERPFQSGHGPDWQARREDKSRELLSVYSRHLVQGASNLNDLAITQLANEAEETIDELFSLPPEPASPRDYYSLETSLAIARLNQAAICRPVSKMAIAEGLPAQRDRALVSEWCARIACAKAGVRFLSPRLLEEYYKDYFMKLGVIDKERIVRDAQAMVDLLALNTTVRNRASESGEHFVLVTATNAMHRAYAGWFLEQNGGRCAVDQYALRQPLQYIPMINLKSYTRVFDLKLDQQKEEQTFQDIIDSINTFLDPSAGAPKFSDTLEMYYLSGSQFRAQARGAKDDDLAAKFRALALQLDWWGQQQDVEAFSRKWNLAYANAIVLTLPLIENRRKQHDHILEDALDKAGGNLIQAQQNIVKNIVLDHMVASLKMLGSTIIAEANQLPRHLRREFKVRPVLPILVDMSDLLRSNLEELSHSELERAVEIAELSGGEASRRPELEEFLRLVFVSIALANWDGAKFLTQQGLKLAHQYASNGGTHQQRRSAVVFDQEFRLLQSVTVRFSCRRAGEFRQARDYLIELAAPPQMTQPSDLQETEVRDLVRAARALLELGALRMTVALRRITIRELTTSCTWPDWLGPELPVEGSTSDGLRAALDDLSEAWRLLDAVKSASKDIRRPRLRLLLQVSANLLLAYILLQQEDEPASKKFEEIGNVAFDMLDQKAGAMLDHNADANHMRGISYLARDAFEYIAHRRAVFPGERSRDYLALYTNDQLFAEHPALCRVIAGSDRDFARLFKVRLAPQLGPFGGMRLAGPHIL